jgi:heat shock protein HslJ
MRFRITPRPPSPGVPGTESVADDVGMSTTPTWRRGVAIVIIVVSAVTGACGDDDDEGSSDVTSADLDGLTFASTDVEGYSLVDGTTIMLTFDGENIAANAGCNGMNGAFSIEDGTLSTGELATTMMACEEPLMRQDDWLAAFLADGAAISLDGDELTLASDDVTLTATATSS